MARWFCVMLLLALLVVHTSARDVPSKEVVDTSTKQGPSSAGLKDEKNFITYGGIGGFAGVGGIGGAAGVGTIGGIGGASGIGGVGGGLGGIGGVGAGAVAGGIFP